MKDTHMTLLELNAAFALPGHLRFKEGPGGLIVAEIANGLGDCTVALQGAHVTHFCPQGQAPVIWVSERAQYAPGKAIRGGVPVCWPWFGPHATDPQRPAHGIARTALWQVLETQVQADGQTFLRLGLPMTAPTRAEWPHPATAELEITVGRSLQLTLVTRNTGTDVLLLGEALHTYFQINDVAQIRVSGLEGCTYLDKVAGGTRHTQQGPVQFDGEVDRIYLKPTADALIEDPGLQRRIRIASQGAGATVVWNPWVEKTSKMGDMAADGFRGMVCVETANAADQVVSVAPSAEHRLTAIYSVEPLV
jgi:glucose-6-phosphate 1-epimerase